MDIVKADFDWISLLLIIGAGVIGIIKSVSKKTPNSPVEIPPVYTTETNEDEKVEWSTDVSFYKPEMIKPIVGEEIRFGDYYKELKQEENKTTSPQETEEEQESAFQLDIRQAIIGSEILRRPEY